MNIIPGQFAMYENLSWHRFQFNSQISIYFDIEQWILSEIRKMSIISSMYINTNSKKITRENVDGADTINNCYCWCDAKL